ncbi:MAG: CotH kinase family protein [Deltaproteobacteria bacterium]|nr:CotH kinase family protein [Deltaproteobacteria bacterium]
MLVHTFFINRLILLTLVLLMLSGCAAKKNHSSNTDSDTVTDTDSGTKTGTDADTVSDIDTSDTNAGDTVSSSDDTDTSFAEQDADVLFNYSHVPTFDITLPEDKWNALIASAMDEEWEQADVSFEGYPIGTVGLRFKGSYGTLYACFDESGDMICPRLSMKIKFSKYNEDLRFFGLKRLNFNANRYDDTRMKEKLAYDVYREMGITAPRSYWANVRVNGKSYGLYGMVEEIDGAFTKNRWPNHPDANVYKEVWPTDTRELDIKDGLRTNEDNGDVSGFVAFASAFTAATTAEDALTVLGQYTDLDQWARYMAVDEAILSYDGVTYFYTDDGTWSHNHNYCFYEDSPGHFTLIPWDVESTFWINPDHAPPHWTEQPEDCTSTYPYWSGLATAPGCDPVFRALTTNLAPFYAASRELLDGPFEEQKMLDAIDTYTALIGEHARTPETPTMYNEFDGAVSYLKSEIPRLRARLEQLIGAPQNTGSDTQ